MKKSLTERQFEELRRYEDGHPHWIGGPPSPSLTTNGHLARVANSGHDRASSMFQITEKGRAALQAFRVKYGLAAAA